MLSFKVHEFHLSGRHYLLLPKLNHAQTQVLGERLRSLRYSVQVSMSIVAKSRQGSIHIDPTGLCWSYADPADAVLPAVPKILAIPKEKVALKSLEAMYFRRDVRGGVSITRMQTRLEHSSLWDALRTSGGCGLAPDERAIASFLMRNAGRVHDVLTDFPFESLVPLVCGRRRYFISSLAGVQAASSLKAVGERRSTNSYLPRDGILRFTGAVFPSHEEWVEAFDELGEWCYFEPA